MSLPQFDVEGALFESLGSLAPERFGGQDKYQLFVRESLAGVGLDPIATAKVEDLICELQETFTVVIVTHNLQQAVRASTYSVFMYLGEVIEAGPTGRLFANPASRLTEDYLTGRFG
jgi:ABC-type phosphate transport system ATPase subunit